MEDWVKEDRQLVWDTYCLADEDDIVNLARVLLRILDNWPSQEAHAESSDESEALRKERDHFQAEAEARWHVLQELRKILGCPDGENITEYAKSLKKEIQHLRWHANLLRNWFNEVRSRLGLKESESNIVAVVDKVRQLTEVNHG